MSTKMEMSQVNKPANKVQTMRIVSYHMAGWLMKNTLSVLQADEAGRSSAVVRSRVWRTTGTDGLARESRELFVRRPTDARRPGYCQHAAWTTQGTRHLPQVRLSRASNTFLKCSMDKFAPLGELMTLPSTPQSAGRGIPLPYYTPLDAFGVSISPPFAPPFSMPSAYRPPRLRCLASHWFGPPFRKSWIHPGSLHRTPCSSVIMNGSGRRLQMCSHICEWNVIFSQILKMIKNT